MRKISYADFSKSVHTGINNKRVPINATIELTYRCNNRCVHCYCSLPADDKEALGKEMSTEEIKHLVDDLAELGSLWLLFTGGEVLLRPDFEEIYSYAKRMGFIISVFTNGNLVNDHIVSLFSKQKPFNVEISLYGATEKTHDKVTRVKGSHKRCLEGIGKLLGAGIKLKLKSMALTINQHEIEAMDRLSSELGCEFRFDPILQKRIDDKDYSDPASYRIPPEDVVRLDRAFPKRMEDYEKFCEKFTGFTPTSDLVHKCGAGKGNINISPYGDVRGCLMMTTDGFSLRELGLRAIWNEKIYKVITKKKSYNMVCDSCKIGNLCGQCSPWSSLENGDEKQEVQYLCAIAKERARDFDFINI